MKRRIRRFRDNYLSLIAGLIGGSLYLWLFWEKNLPNSLDNLFLGGITVSTGLAGFLIASMSIIFSLEEKYIIKQLKRANLYDKLIRCFVDAVRWNFASLTIGLVGLFVDFELYKLWHNWFFACWLLIFITALCASYRVKEVFFFLPTENFTSIVKELSSELILNNSSTLSCTSVKQSKLSGLANFTS